VALHEAVWFNANVQRFFRFPIDHYNNMIGLRADIHFCFDQKMWCMVLKEGRLVCQTLRQGGGDPIHQYIPQCGVATDLQQIERMSLRTHCMGCPASRRILLHRPPIFAIDHDHQGPLT